MAFKTLTELKAEIGKTLTSQLLIDMIDSLGSISGTYTPTVSNETGITVSFIGPQHYEYNPLTKVLRIFGSEFGVTSTSVGINEFDLSLPTFLTTTPVDNSVGGVGTSFQATEFSSAFIIGSVNGENKMRFKATSITTGLPVSVSYNVMIKIS